MKHYFGKYKVILRRSADGRTRDQLKDALCLMFQEILPLDYDTPEFTDKCIEYESLRQVLIDMGETHAALNELVVTGQNAKAVR